MSGYWPELEKGGESVLPSDIEPIVRNTELTSFATHDSSITAQDTVLGAFGKAQGQIKAIKDSVGANNGIAELDEAGKIKTSQLSSGWFRYQDQWFPASNTPEIVDNMDGLVGGEFYICEEDGAHDFGDGPVEFSKFDIVLYAGRTGKWVKHGRDGGIDSINGISDKHAIIHGTQINLSPTDSTTITAAIAARSGNRISVKKTLTAKDQGCSIDFGGIRWGYEYVNNDHGIQFYNSIDTIKTVYFTQKSYYDNAMEGRTYDGIEIPLTPQYYDTLNWSGGRELTVIVVRIGDELWRGEMIIHGRAIQMVDIWVELISKGG